MFFYVTIYYNTRDGAKRLQVYENKNDAIVFLNVIYPITAMFLEIPIEEGLQNLRLNNKDCIERGWAKLQNNLYYPSDRKIVSITNCVYSEIT